MIGALAGLGVVESMKGAGRPSFTVVQADSATRAATARQAMMSLFISKIIV